jgi:hypothetical protein
MMFFSFRQSRYPYFFSSYHKTSGKNIPVFFTGPAASFGHFDDILTIFYSLIIKHLLTSCRLFVKIQTNDANETKSKACVYTTALLFFYVFLSGVD